jgi:hypothetical protein
MWINTPVLLVVVSTAGINTAAYDFLPAKGGALENAFANL